MSTFSSLNLRFFPELRQTQPNADCSALRLIGAVLE